MSVPSNLIPTRITQLPLAPVADENSLMMIVYQGNNYQIRVGDLLSVAGVPVTTQVIAGTGMTGGGQLTGNVTLSIANGGVGSTQLNTTGVASGVYGNATNIPVFTVDTNGRVTAATTIPATISGYVPTSTQVIAGNGLTGGGALNGNVTLAASYSASAPELGFQTGSVGAANTLARSDHKHPAVDLSADDQVDNLLGLGNGGTARSLVAAAGAIIWSGADGLYVGPVGLSGQVLVSGGAGAPTWGSALLVVDQPANVVYAGPAAGATAPTAFRALVNADLPASGVAANTYGSTTAIPVITVNAKGVITSATTAAITGALVYQGAWNASTNTPTLASGVGVSGYYYVVSVAGSTNLDGITDWQVGDWAIFNGAAWQKIDQTNTVSSVNGQTGVVSIAYADLAGAIPTWNQNTTGTADNVTGTVAIANGGSGQTTAQAAMDAFAGAVTSGSYLRGDGTNVVMNTIQVADVPTLNQNTTGTADNVTGTVAIANGGSGQTTASAAFNALSPITTTGDLILGTGVNTASRLAIGSNGYLLTSNGTTASWVAAPISGVTTFSAGTTGLTPSTASTGAVSLAGTLVVGNGGTGATTLTGYVKGTGTSALTASSTIPNTDITGLGTMSTQNATSVAVTGGAIDGTTVGATTAAAGTFTTVTGTTFVGISGGTF
jgi:trimeric autotransporter adhesin